MFYLKRRSTDRKHFFLAFSRSIRIPYWTAPPAFYSRIDVRKTFNSEFSASSPVDPEKPPRLPHDTAYELGESEYAGDDDNDRDWVMVPPVPRSGASTKYKREATAPQAAPMRPEHDVRKGGYPTFSGGGIDQTGRHVPSGVLERRADGSVLRYMGQDGQAAVKPVDVRSNASTPRTGPSDRHAESRSSTVDDSKRQGNGNRPAEGARARNIDERRSHERVQAPNFQANTEVTQAVPSRTPTVKRNKVSRPSSGFRALESNATPQLLPPPKTRKRTKEPLTPITEDREEPTTANLLATATPATVYSTESDVHEMHPLDDSSAVGSAIQPLTDKRELRKSLMLAASDLGHRFPIPPSRPMAAIDAASVAKAARQNSGDNARRKSSEDPRNPPIPLLAQPPVSAMSNLASALHHREVDDVLKTPTPPPLGEGNLDIREAREATGRSALREKPVTALSVKDDINVIRPVLKQHPSDISLANSSSGSQPSVDADSKLKLERAVSDQTSALRTTSISRLATLRSSMAIPRSPSSRSTRSERMANGVRFDLSPIPTPSSTGSHSAPSSPTRSLSSPLEAPRKGGMRIPGTRLTLSLPRFSVPGTPRSIRRASLSSLDEISTSSSDTTSGASNDDQAARPESVLSEASRDSNKMITAGEDMVLQVARRSNTVNTLGGQYLTSGSELRNTPRRHSSIDI